MSAYYNERDPYAAQWLRNLIAVRLIADGDVDERSIADVRPDDLAGYRQCHFFAGIGVWSHALRLADWPDDRPVWTGSCPCQPFSAAGARKGSDDHRHLWPEFARLIGERRPSVVFGEQVASKDGRAWLHAVRSDLEGMGYAVGAADLCAAGVGAPHIRQRLYWVADGHGQRWQSVPGGGLRADPEHDAQSRGSARRVDDAEDAGLEGHRGGYCSDGGRIAEVRSTAKAGEPCGVADSAKCGCREERPHPGWVAPGDRPQRVPAGPRTSGGNHGVGPTIGFWSPADWLWCRDKRWRPVEPGTFPLAPRTPARVGLLRAYGNAIVPQVAAEFIRASAQAIEGRP